MRFFYLFVCLAASLWLPHAAANTPSGQPAAIALSQLGSKLGTPHLTVRENLPRAVGIERIASEPALFIQPFDPSIAYAMGPQSAMWLHLRVLADGPSAAFGWTLELPKPYIDRAEFYQKDALGTWQMQAAGDRIAHAQWPVQGLNPQFALPIMAAGVHDFYFKIQGDIPLHFSVHLQRTDAANTRSQNRFFLGGLLLGVCALMLAFTAILAVSTSQKIYLWYAIFVGSSCLAAATHMGLTSYALWPHAAVWPEYSNYGLIMVAVAAQLQFCRAMFLPSKERSSWRAALTGAMAASIAAIILHLCSDNAFHRQVLYFLVASLCTLLGLVLLVRAISQGNRTAWLWLTAYVPLIVCVGLASADSFGFAIHGVPYDAPVYALLFEASVLLIALHSHAKYLQTQQARRHLLDSIDPHTGFVASRIHDATAEALWRKARDNRSDIAVAYVEAKSADMPSLLQIVRLLRTVVRDDDTISHVDKNLYAILMPGLHAGEDLAARLSRLVALGLMAGKDMAATNRIQFRIAASSRGYFGGPWRDMDAALIAKLKQSAGWEQRSIRFVRDRSSSDFDAVWQRAVTASAQLDTP